MSSFRSQIMLILEVTPVAFLELLWCPIVAVIVGPRS